MGLFVRSLSALDLPRSTVEQIHRGSEIQTSVWYIFTLLSISLPTWAYSPGKIHVLLLLPNELVH